LPPPLLEPAFQLSRTALGLHAAHHQHRVVGAGACTEIEHTSQTAALGVVGSKHNLADSGLHQSPGAHRAGFEGDQQGAVVEAPVAPEARSLLQRHQLGMAQWLLIPLAPVASPAHGSALGIEHNGSHWDFAFAAHGLSAPQQPLHPEDVLRRLQIHRFCFEHNASA